MIKNNTAVPVNGTQSLRVFVRMEIVNIGRISGA